MGYSKPKYSNAFHVRQNKMKKINRVIVTMEWLRWNYVMLSPCRNRCSWYGGTPILVTHRFYGILIHGKKWLATETHSQVITRIRSFVQSLIMACRYLNTKGLYRFSVFFCFKWAHWACHTKWVHHTDNRTIIFGNYAHHITVWVLITKEDIDLLIEEKWSNRDEFSTFIAAKYKLPSPKEINLALYQGKQIINLCKTLFEKHYAG